MAPQHAPVRLDAATPAAPGQEMGYQLIILPVGGELKCFLVGQMENPQSSGPVVPGPLATTTVAGADDDGPGSSRRYHFRRLMRAFAESTRAAADLKAATEWLCPIISDVLEKKAPPSSPPVSQDPAYRLGGEEEGEEMEVEMEDPFAWSARRIREAVESELATYKEANERASQAFKDVYERAADAGAIQLSPQEETPLHPYLQQLLRQTSGTK